MGGVKREFVNRRGISSVMCEWHALTRRGIVFIKACIKAKGEGEGGAARRGAVISISPSMLSRQVRYSSDRQTDKAQFQNSRMNQSP